MDIAMAQSDSVLTPAANGETQPSPVETLGRVILRPRAAFERMRDAKRGHWWLVFLVTVLAVALLAIATTMVQARMFQNISLPAGATQPGQSTTLQIVITLATGIIGALAGYLFRGVIVFALGLALGGRATFKQVVRMAAWSTLPVAIRKLVQATTSFVTGAFSMSGVSGLLSTREATSMPMFNLLLGSFDIYLIWSLALLGIGAAVTSKLSKGKSVVLVMVYLALAVGVTLALNVASGAVTGLLGEGFRLPGMRMGRPPR